MIDEETLGTRLPSELQELGELASDLWWTWQPNGDAVFRAIDPVRWERAGRNPVRFLRDASPTHLRKVAQDKALLAKVHALHLARERDLARPFARTDVASPERPIAFFCAEYGIHAMLPIYSGGLGVLAGDILKQASDSAIAMIAVGLFYRRGYFHQRLDRSGWQHEYWTPANDRDLPLGIAHDESGKPLRVRVRLRGRDVFVRVWRVQVGRIPLFLLDTDVPENDLTSRFITSTLYIGDRTLRLMQYAVLAIGGVRVLDALGIRPSIFHLNEGHAALAALELVRVERTRDAPLDRAVDAVRSRIVFTTHTPVAAGNERYDLSDIESILSTDPRELGVDRSELAALARGKPEHAGQLGVTELALRTSRSANGVSRAHGAVARGMWQHMWPGRNADQIPITHVTNGVHVRTWMAAPMRELLDRHLGPTWPEEGDEALLARVDSIPDAEIWAVRNELRRSLVRFIRETSVLDRLARGESIAYAEGAATTFDDDVLTLGFARRVASYKRLHLLIADRARSLALLHGSRRVQVVIAGRAHPMDDGAKELVKAIFSLKDLVSKEVAFVEDYDLAAAAPIVAGCDVWLNLPRPPLEASGTSGMKAALNGALNVSVLDGWWHEAFEEKMAGWGIASSSETDERTQDARDAETLYGLLEREVVPLFYERDASGVPTAWLRRVKTSLRTIATRFSARRMLDEYVDEIYRV